MSVKIIRAIMRVNPSSPSNNDSEPDKHGFPYSYGDRLTEKQARENVKTFIKQEGKQIAITAAVFVALNGLCLLPAFAMDLYDGSGHFDFQDEFNLEPVPPSRHDGDEAVWGAAMVMLFTICP